MDLDYHFGETMQNSSEVGEYYKEHYDFSHLLITNLKHIVNGWTENLDYYDLSKRC